MDARNEDILMINSVNKNATAQTSVSFGHKKSAPSPVKTTKTDGEWAQISEEARHMSDALALREELKTNGFNFRFAEVKAKNGEITRFIITPGGIWRSRDDKGISVRVDAEQGLPGFSQSALQELAHLSQMLQHFQPEHDAMRAASREATQNIGLGQNVDATDPKEAFKSHLFSLASTFAAMRENFNNPNQHAATSHAAFRLLLSGTMGLAARLVRINLGSESTADMGVYAIEKLRALASEKIEFFAEDFLAKFESLGLQGAFDAAWANFLDI